MRLASWSIVAAALVGCGPGEDSHAKPLPCEPIGKASACVCTDGRSGAQRCREDGAWEACECATSAGDASSDDDGQGGGGGDRVMVGDDPDTGPSADAEPGAAGGVGGATQLSDDACDLGDLDGCSCAGDNGRRFCVNGAFGECACAAPGAGGESAAGGAAGEVNCDASGASCDEKELECQRAKLACPSDRVANIAPFDEGVYLVGTLSPGSASATAVGQFWPTTSLDYATGFGDYGGAFRFRPTDNALFYHDLRRGILINGSSTTTSDDEVQSTSPCDANVAADFGFDGNGVLHYRCGDSLLRADGETVATDITNIAGVLGDGRIVVTRGGDSGQPGIAYVVLSVEGAQLASFYPSELLVGALTLLPLATTVQVSTAYVALARRYESGEEVVVYGIDAESRFRLVRRVVISDLGRSQLVTSDGTIFIREQDDSTTTGERIRAYLSRGGSRIVWREAEAVYVFSHVGVGLLTGPPQRGWR